jgi:hypothetical protein
MPLPIVVLETITPVFFVIALKFYHWQKNRNRYQNHLFLDYLYINPRLVLYIAG